MPAPAPESAAARRLREFMGYGLVSVCAFIADIAILFVLTRYCDWPPLWAAATSFVIGAVLGYLLCVRWVFHCRRIENRALELCAFVLLGGAGLIVNVLVIALAINLAGLNLLVAKLLASGCTFVCNFALRRYFLFTRIGALASEDAAR
jgi:putative flippase GtrA